MSSAHSALRRTLAKFLLLCAALLAVPAEAPWAQGKPKAVVITGRAVDAADRAADDKAAAEAKKDLEAAGYEVEVLKEPTKDAAVTKIKDPTTAALVVIAHGPLTEQWMTMKKADGSKDPLKGSDLTGPFDHIKIATLHACGQNLQTWKDKFPKSDFKSWDGCVYPSTILEWQKKKEYEKAETPKIEQETADMHSLLENGQFVTDNDGEPSLHALNTLSGNWAMSPLLANAFGSQNYNFFVYDDDNLGSNPELLFSAQVGGGLVEQHQLDELTLNPSFNIYFTHDLFTEAIEDPFVLLDPSLLGLRVAIEPAVGNPTDPTTLFAGVAKNIFNIDPTLPNGGHIAAPSPLALLGLAGLVLAMRRLHRAAGLGQRRR